MRLLPLVAVLPLVALAGCMEAEDPCSDVPDMRGVVESADGRSVQVRLPDGEPLVLHLSAQVYVSEAGHCELTGPSGIRVGDTLAFHVDEVAESYPPQGWPEVSVVLRAAST